MTDIHNYKSTFSLQMNRFRRLKDREGRNILNNFRPLQPINGREIQLIKRENIQYIPMARN